MTALSKDQTINILVRDYEGYKMDYPVAASTTIYSGGFVGLNNAGNLVMLTVGAVAATLDPWERFVGVALAHVDNSSGSAGDLNCQVLVNGSFEYALSAAATPTDIGKPVFASDDNTLTKVGIGTVFIGWIRNVPSTGVVVVEFGAANNSHPLISRISAPIDCAVASKALLIHPTENHNGLVIVHLFGIITEVFAGAEDQGIITIEDTAGTDSGVTLTPSDGAADVVNDLIPAIGATTVVGTLGLLMVPVPADLGLQAFVTQLADTTGTVKVGVIAMPIA